MESGLVMIIVALLAALVFTMGLNALVGCLLRCRSQTVLESSNEAAIRGGNTDLKALPIMVYTATSKPRPVPMDCPICLAEFAEGEEMRVLPKCNHGFHLKCIDIWLVSHSSCPMCRLSLTLHNKKPGGAAMAEAPVLNNGVHIVIETTDLTRPVAVVSPHTETFQRTLYEAVVTPPSSPLVTSS